MNKIIQYIQFFKRAFFNCTYLDDHMELLQSSISHLKNMVKFEIAQNKFETLALHSTDLGIRNLIDQEEIIVSLTTYGKRINSVFRTIESIFQQTYKVNKIILWLGDKEFSSIKNLPITLQMQIQRGLEIKFVKDIRSYTKLIPALKEFPNSTIITIDDDILYPHDLIERLINAHRINPSAVCCVAIRRLELKNEHEFKPYRFHELSLGNVDIDSRFYIAEGFGGVLYPPNALPKETFNEELFLKLAPYADDIWFKAMELINSTPIVPVQLDSTIWDSILVDEYVQDIGLVNQNVFNDKNDVQLEAVFRHYKLFDYLCTQL